MSKRESVKIGEKVDDSGKTEVCLLEDLVADFGNPQSSQKRSNGEDIRRRGGDADIRICRICQACVAIEYYDGQLLDVAPIEKRPSLNLCIAVPYEPFIEEAAIREL